jgi:DNA-binding response OmpR family regulator
VGGLWLLERIRDFEIPTPVVIVSGEGSQIETIRAIRLGARDYVIKDHVEIELVERIERAVVTDARQMIEGRELQGRIQVARPVGRKAVKAQQGDGSHHTSDGCSFFE